MLISILSCIACAATGPAYRNAGAPTNALVAAAQGADADELLVLRNGVPIVRWSSARYEGLHELMSVTKSVVALALGKLVDDGKIRLSDRLDSYFAVLRDEPRGAITLEQVLEMSSGLGSDFPHEELADIIDEALKQPLLHAPGSTWFYNNDAVNLLSRIVEVVDGGSLEQYVQRTLFEPLGISKWSWYADEHGHTWVMTGLAIGPDDFSKIGQLVLDKGMWHGQQIVSQAWINRLSQPSAAWDGYGALWWIGFGFYPEDASKTTCSRAAQNFIWAQGFANQLLVVDPATKTVFVLQTELLRRANRDDVGGPFEDLLDAFCTFTTQLPR
jgi:CubicO group peptidase (beta-lactamase class C family)